MSEGVKVTEELTLNELTYSVGQDIFEALGNYRKGKRYANPQAAYNSIPYFDELEYDYEVFRFAVKIEATQVEPPY